MHCFPDFYTNPIPIKAWEEHLFKFWLLIIDTKINECLLTIETYSGHLTSSSLCLYIFFAAFTTRRKTSRSHVETWFNIPKVSNCKYMKQIYVYACEFSFSVMNSSVAASVN